MKLYARQFLQIVLFTIKSVYTIEMILCHCNQQCGQVSDWEKPDIFPPKDNACRTEDKTSKRRTCPPFAGRLVTLDVPPIEILPTTTEEVFLHLPIFLGSCAFLSLSVRSTHLFLLYCICVDKYSFIQVCHPAEYGGSDAVVLKF